jgi:hypothetical protein
MKLSKIMFAILFCYSLLFSQDINAQKCKFFDEKVNPITGEVLRRTHGEVGRGILMVFSKKGDQMFVACRLTFYGEKNFKIDSGLVMTYKLLDGTILQLRTIEAILPTTEVSSGQIYTYYNPSFFGSNEVFEKIRSIGISAILVSVDNKDFTFEPNEKINKRICEKIRCLLIS